MVVNMRSGRVNHVVGDAIQPNGLEDPLRFPTTEVQSHMSVSLTRPVPDGLRNLFLLVVLQSHPVLERVAAVSLVQFAPIQSQS